MIGKKVTHYEILAPIGKGGMGEVYRARVTKLGRDVAVKVLPSEMSSEPERLARFDREARTLATLQHANIASIYGFENVENLRFLVTGDKTLSFGAPKILFSQNVRESYTVSNDGERFLTNELPPTDPRNVGARLIQNWPAALRR